MELSTSFKRFQAPESGRTVVQLTQGDSLNYPLYYFIPSITQDNRFLIHHKVSNQEVQIYRLDLTTGEDACITDAKSQDTFWYPWCVDKGKGVLDHRSLLNVERNTVIYFDDNQVFEVNVETLEKSLLFELPPDRLAIGQNCVTTDGKWLIYIHHDRKTFEKIKTLSHFEGRSISKHTALCAYNFETKEHRDILYINSPIHHVLPYDEKHIVFCHPTMEDGMLFTSIEGGYYTHLRTQQRDGGTVCHYIATQKGIMYEILGSDTGRVYCGIYNPFTHNKFEIPLPKEFAYTHTGYDEEAKIWFYENCDFEKNVHDMYLLTNHDAEKGDNWVKLFGNWPTYGGGQSSHFHPRITPDRKWVLFTAGDSSVNKNHIYLLDISDVEDTKGIPKV